MGTDARKRIRSAVRDLRVAALKPLEPVYRRLKHSPVSGVLRLPPLLWLRRRLVPGMSATDVLDVLDTLERGGVPCWLVGGWGVDALVGRQTRRHPDVDVAIDRRFLASALSALAATGFQTVHHDLLPAWMPRLIILRDARRRWVELMPVDVPEPAPGEDGRPESMRFRYDDDSITTGTVGGRSVRCLAAPVQLLFHSKYAPRANDRHDVRVLTERFRLPAPAGYS